MEEKTLDVSTYNELVKSMQLETIDLAKLNVEKFDLYNGNQEINVEMNFSIEGYEKTNNELHIKPQLEITMINQDKKIISQIKCSYFVVYTSELIGKREDVYLEMFIGNTVQIAVWPYFRELVASLTSRMGYSSFILPIYVRE